jgi:peroxidase
MLFGVLFALVGVSQADPTADPAIVAHAGHGYAAVPVTYCANGGYCVPPAACAPWYLESLYDPTAACYLAHGTPGVCCAPKKHSYPSRGVLERATAPPGSESPLEFDEYTLNHAAFVGLNEVAWNLEFEQELTRREVFVNKGSLAFSHNAFFKSKPKARKMADDAMVSITGSQDLGQRFELKPAQAGYGLNSFSIEGTLISDKCPKGGECDPYAPYRNPDATCNNLENPLWGASNTAFQRILLPQYSDGVWRPKKSKDNTALPSARLISVNIVPDVDAPSELDTHNVMQWGQFVDHDITHTPLFRLSNPDSSGIQCCMSDGSGPISKLVLHPECFPIEIPDNDPFFQQHGQRCMHFVRSLPAPQLSCSFGYGEQMNQITGMHDASNVYGSDKEDEESLRANKGGLLKVYTPEEGQSRTLLPQEEDESAKDECEIDETLQDLENQKCFKAGDSRANEQPGLTVYHTVWVREHNRLAAELAYLNPHWDDERLYQEARKILIAEMQHVTYNEWLPIVLGTDYMADLDILPVTYGYNTKYDPKINPSIVNSFASAAFRFGHTLVQGMLDLVEEVHYERKTTRMIPLSETFFNPELMYVPGGLDKFLVGLATQPRQKFDNIFTEQVTNHLFQAKNHSFGMDLVALNIQRGRDHGIPGYNEFREICGLKRVEEFDYFQDLIPVKIVERLKLIYDNVDDVDLFIGGISEVPVPGALLGPTFQCLVGDQFKRLQHGDRFYYDSSSNPGKFTEEQLAEVRKSNLARIHCDNGDHLKLMQPLVFRKPSVINPLVPCDAITIPKISLYPWKEGYHPHAYHAAPVHVAPVHHHPVAAAPAYTVTPAPTVYSPAPTAYSPQPSINFPSAYQQPQLSHYAPSGAETQIKSFVHTPLHRFNVAVGSG